MYLRPAISSFLAAFLALGIIEACSDDDPVTAAPGTDAASGSDTATPAKDAATAEDASQDADASSSNCPGEIKTGNGETCIGYGTGSACDPACGQPYGYVCVNGPPPSFTGCREVSKSGLGNSYCCPKNECVAQPDQNSVCNDAGAGKTKRYQCPPDASAPPNGCVEHNSGGTNLEKLYCCP